MEFLIMRLIAMKKKQSHMQFRYTFLFKSLGSERFYVFLKENVFA